MTWPFSGAYEGDAWRVLMNEIVSPPPGPAAPRVLIDVGANKGNFTWEVLQAISAYPPPTSGADWTIHMFEPDPDMAARLRLRAETFQHAGPIYTHEIAVADEAAAAVPMFFPDRSLNDGVQPHPYGALAKHVFQWKEGAATTTRDVAVTTVDEMFGGVVGVVDVLKIGEQGLQPSASLGAGCEGL
jgi:FkbM family methyltransferase